MEIKNRKNGQRSRVVMMFRDLVVLIGLMFLLLPALVKAEVELPNGQFYLNVVDLEVKSLTGKVSVERTWYQRKWHFNRIWSRLEFKRDLADDSIQSITRNWRVYKKQDTSEGYFVYDEKSLIKMLPSGGFRWENRQGDWIEYDLNGKALSYGDRNNIPITFHYDAESRLTGIFDSNGNQLIWFEYGLNDHRVTAVHDATAPTPRRVSYSYNNAFEIYQVTDVNEHIWTYIYAPPPPPPISVSSAKSSSSGSSGSSGSVGTISQGVIVPRKVIDPNSQYFRGYKELVKILDPESRPTNIAYYSTRRVHSVKKDDGTGESYSYFYDRPTKVYRVKTTLSSGVVKDTWYNEDGEIIRNDINNKTVYTMRKEGRKRIKEDELGNVTINEYNQWDWLVKVTNSDRSTHSYLRGSDFSQVLQEIDERGVITKNEYDTHGNLIRKTEAFGLPEERVTEYDYDALGRLWKERTLADAVTALAETVYSYDASGNIDTITDPEGNVTDYLSYDVMGNPLQWRDGRGKLWQRSYDGMGRILTETNPLDHVTKYKYDGAGNKTHVIDAELNTTETQFDINNRVKAIIDALNNQTKLVYNAAGQLVSITDAEGKSTYINYDGFGRRYEVIDGVGNVVRYHYGEPGSGATYKQISRVEFPTYSEIYNYDQRGHRISTTRQTSNNGDFVTVYQYDLVGNKIAETDPKLRTTHYHFDALNRLDSTTNPLNDTVSNSYDDRDNLLSVTNEKKVVIRRFSYDRNNRVKTETRPTGEVWSFDHDQADNQLLQQDAKGQVTRYRYDDAGRRDQIQYYNDLASTTALKTVTFGFDKLGNITSYDDGTMSGSIGYDALARKTGESVNYGVFSKTYQYFYYKNGKRRSFTAPDNSVITYGYDLANRLNQIKLPGTSGSVVYTDYRWKKPGRVIYPGGAKRILGYDDLLRVSDIDVFDPADNPIMDYRYTYDRAGNIDTKTTEHGLYKYGYDQLDRLTSAINPTLDDEVYDYDPVGNRIYSGDVSGQWIYNDSNELRSYGATSLDYDDNGSTVLKQDVTGRTAYEYNLENRLQRVLNATTNAEISSYHYDPFGRRVWKDVAGVRTYFMYADEGLIGEFNSSGTEIRSYLYKPETEFGTAPIFLKQGITEGFYQLDHLGTPQKVMATTGNVLWAGESKVFGEIVERVSLVINPLRFSGQFFDEGIDEVYNFHRYYNPSTGRYIQSDPVGLNGGFNTYTYAMGNPIKFIDNLGLYSDCASCIKDCNDRFWWDRDDNTDNWINKDPKDCLYKKKPSASINCMLGDEIIYRSNKWYIRKQLDKCLDGCAKSEDCKNPDQCKWRL